MSTSSIHDSTVNAFYLAFYGRPADPAGLKFWAQQLASNNGELGAITQAFATSEEALVRFGDETLAGRIGEIYQALFNRAPDAAGLEYWMGVVEQGHASLADVSVAIMRGALGSDATLTALRQQAVDAFTAQVEAGGTEYSGYAAVEAARILVRAVTADATAADVDALVKAAVSFADTATTTPAVVEAIAVNTTLLALFDTTRGKGDPVALAQALSDTAKAAAGDPVTLESLLRGGGMDKVLKVMPARATLQDVVDALAKGGLPAAVEVVYPSAPATPPVKAMAIQFAGVAQGEDDLAPADNVTNVKYADVKFKYSGKDLAAGQHFEYSTDGATWHTVDATGVDAQARTVTIAGLNLSGSLDEYRVAPAPGADVTTTVALRAVEGSKVIARAETDIVYDASAPLGQLSFQGIDDGPSDVNTTTADKADIAFGLDGAYADAIVQWRIAGDEQWAVLDKPSINGVFTLADIDLSEDDVTIEMRLIDAAGNVGDTITQFIDGPAGVAVTPTFTVMPSVDGLMAGANVAGTLQLVDGKHVTDVKAATQTQNGMTVFTIGAQDTVASGTLHFKTTGGALLDDQFGLAYTLGTDDGDTMSGPIVWGFDGDDTITGTSGRDTLVGGAGDDTISAGAGADMVYGGAGADLIDLGADEAADRVFYEADDAAGAVFVDGGSTQAMDKISSFGTGDAITVQRSLLGTSTVQSTYLSAGDSTAWAVVRGSDADGHFKAGTGASDDDYMVQWGDGEHVNSVIVRDYGTLAPMAMLTDNANTLGFIPRPTSTYVSSNLQLQGVTSHLVMWTSEGGIGDVTDPAGFALYDVATGSDIAATAYTSPVTVAGSVLSFSGRLDIGLYKMSWDTGAFTTGPKVLAGKDVLIAGGVVGHFHYRGFEMASQVTVHGDATFANDEVKNQAFVSDGLHDARIRTGGGNDVVSDNGVRLTIVYDVFDEAAHDIILGFDSEGEDDVISFEGGAALLLDKDGSGLIEWVEAPGAAVLADSEAVAITATTDMHFGPGTALGTSANAISRVVNVGAIAQDDHLLILVRDDVEDAGVLLLYRNLDGSGTIEGNELTTIALFNDGIPDTDDIVVVGTAQLGIQGG